MTNTNKPVDEIRLGTIRASIWRNLDKSKSPYYSVGIERSYADENGEWHTTNSFARDELLTLAKVADFANTRVHQLQQMDRQAERNTPVMPNAAARAANAKQVKSRSA